MKQVQFIQIAMLAVQKKYFFYKDLFDLTISY